MANTKIKQQKKVPRKRSPTERELNEECIRRFGITREQYTRELEEAIAEVERGEVTTHEEALKRLKRG